jgi:perosamine synthetase
MRIPFFVPWINQTEIDSVSKILKQRWLTDGRVLPKFEKKMCNYLHSKYASGVSSGTHALHLALKTLGIGPGDEVILPNLTFIATEAAVTYCNAKPILVDVDSDSFTIMPKEIRRKITSKTKAIIPVHYAGQSCDLDEIINISKEYNIPIVEDCAHALGSKYHKKFVGTFGDFGCFSFYPTKIITTGEGGMVVSKKRNHCNKINLLRSQGINISPLKRELKNKWNYDVNEIGFNYRLDEIRSALGLSQFKRINQSIKLRQNIAKEYDNLLKNIPGIIIPKKYNDRNHIYHLYTVKIEKDYSLSRDQVKEFLRSKGIGTSVQYRPLHLLTYNKKEYKNKQNDFKNSNKIKDEILSLPIFPQMTHKQIQLICKYLKTI